MNEEQALVAAIRADPNDNTRRLAFADWLDEHDQPERAAWVRDVEIFWWMGPDYVSPLPQILQQLRHNDPDERDKAGPVVARLRGAAAPMLRAAFAAADTALRREIAQLFTWIREGMPRPLPELIAEARGVDEDAVRLAVNELRWHGAAAATAIPELIELWEWWAPEDMTYEYSHGPAWDVAFAFKSIGPEAVKAIRSLLAGPRDNDRLTEVIHWNLREMGPDTIPELQRLLADPDAWVRYHAAVALFHLGRGTPEARSVVSELVEHPDEDLALLADWTLRKSEAFSSQ